MKPDEIKHLLGGYATGTLTPEEQKALFDAAIEDQRLFEALAGEQPLKEAFDNPAIRRELRAALESRASWRERFRPWLRWQVPLAAGGALAAAALTVVALVRYSGPSSAPPEKQMAAMRTPAVEQRSPAPAQEPAAVPSRVPASKPAAKKALAMRPEKATAPGTIAAAVAPPVAAPAPPSPALEKAEESAKLTAPDAVRQRDGGVRTSMLAAEQGARPGGRNQARELFYAAPPPQAPAPARNSNGVVGGVIGGYPAGAPMARAGSKAADTSPPAPPPAPPPVQAIGLRYSGRDVPGSPPQLLVESNTDAVLYIFRRNQAGEWLPVTTGGMSLKARTPTTTPAIGVDGSAPAPRVLLVVSRALLTELAETGPALTAALNNLRAHNDPSSLIIQTGSGSTYVVLPEAKPGAIIVTPVVIP